MVTEELAYSRAAICPTCQGDCYIAEWPLEGEAPEDAWEPCPDCQGTGTTPPTYAPYIPQPAPF